MASLDIDRNLSQLSRVWVCKSNSSLKHHSGTFWWRDANAINISLFGFIDAQQALEKLRRLPHLLRPLLKREWWSVKTLRNMNMWTSSSVIRNSSNNQWQYTYMRFTSSDFLPSVPQYHYPFFGVRQGDLCSPPADWADLYDRFGKSEKYSAETESWKFHMIFVQFEVRIYRAIKADRQKIIQRLKYEIDRLRT